MHSFGKDFCIKKENQKKANRFEITKCKTRKSIKQGKIHILFSLFESKIETFGTIHNGPVLIIERNPFISDVMLSVGQRIFAIWCESNPSIPVLWRRRNTNITCAQWSPTRCSLFFIACYDGTIEIWELLTRTDDVCISYESGASIITVITQHKLSLPTDILMIADHKADLRAFTLPSSISQPKFDDHEVRIIYVVYIQLVRIKWPNIY